MLICSQCNTQNPPHLGFCARCNHPLSPHVSPQGLFQPASQLPASSYAGMPTLNQPAPPQQNISIDIGGGGMTMGYGDDPMLMDPELNQHTEFDAQAPVVAMQATGNPQAANLPNSAIAEQYLQNAGQPQHAPPPSYSSPQLPQHAPPPPSYSSPQLPQHAPPGAPAPNYGSSANWPSPAPQPHYHPGDLYDDEEDDDDPPSRMWLLFLFLFSLVVAGILWWAKTTPIQP